MPTDPQQFRCLICKCRSTSWFFPVAWNGHRKCPFCENVGYVVEVKEEGEIAK